MDKICNTNTTLIVCSLSDWSDHHAVYWDVSSRWCVDVCFSWLPWAELPVDWQ